jgi:hypothetical protein
MKKISLFLIIFLLYKNIVYSVTINAAGAIATIKCMSFYLINKRSFLAGCLKAENSISFYFSNKNKQNYVGTNLIKNLCEKIKLNNKKIHKNGNKICGEIQKQANNSSSYNKKTLFLPDYSIYLQNYKEQIFEIEKKEKKQILSLNENKNIFRNLILSRLHVCDNKNDVL